MMGELLGAIAIVLSAGFGYLGHRASSRASVETEQAKAAIAAAARKAENDLTSGRMALEVAQSVRDELVEVKAELTSVRSDLNAERDHNDEVRDQWRKHDDWDDLVLAMLEKALPGSTAGLPPRPELPPRRPLRRDAEAARG